VAIGGVVINFAAKTVDAVRDINKLTRELTGLDRQGTTTGRSLKSNLKIGVAAVGAAMVTAGVAALDFAKAAAEDNAEAENLSRTLRKIPGITQDMIDANSAWIDSMEIATTVADTDLRTAVSKLALATGNLERAQELTTIAVDAAAGSGKSLKTVTDALAKAATGNTSALQRQFPWLDKNKDGAVDLDEALGGLKGAYEGAAKAAAARKPWERFSAVMGQLKEIIGEQLLPYLEDFSAWLADKKNQKRLSEFGEDVGTVVRAVAGLVRIVWGLVSALQAAWGWLDSATKKVDAFYDAVNNMVTWPWEPGGRWPWQRSGGRAAPAAAGATTRTTAAPLYVTDEQVYRAVNQLILRGDTRNGRARLAVP
jgi:hypothetical protein